MLVRGHTNAPCLTMHFHKNKDLATYLLRYNGEIPFNTTYLETNFVKFRE